MKEKTIDYMLRATWQAVAKMYNEEAAKYDTTMATGFALLSIDPEDGTPSTSLGPKMGMEATSLSRTLKGMEEKGLIERRPHPQDKRSVLIHLTDFGKEKRALSKEVVLRFNECIREKIDANQWDNFMKVGETILELIQSKSIYNEPYLTESFNSQYYD